KLILARTGGNVLVRVRINIGIGAQGNRRAQIFLASDAINTFQLGLALDIEAVYAVFDPVLDFLARFAYAGKSAFCRIAACREHTKKLAAGNDVETSARGGEQLQDRAI